MTDMGELRAVWLETFVATVEAGKRTAAGEAMGLDQGTITKHIKKLEVWCRTPLIETGGSSVRLTEAGTAFFSVAQRVLSDLRDARRTVPSTAVLPPPKVSGKDVVI